MKITIEHYDEKVSIETKRDDIAFDEFMEYIKRITKSIYSETLVEDYWR